MEITNPDDELSGEVEVIVAPLDNFAKIIQKRYEDSKQYREPYEAIWEEAYDAYRAKYPSKLSKADELAEERGIFVNQTRRKVNSAKVKIGALLFDDGRVPFQITPSRRPRYIPPELANTVQDKAGLLDALSGRARAMEDRIRDIFDRTGYVDTIQNCIHEMCLYGTGVTKAIVLSPINFPVYKNNLGPDEEIERIESQLEQELLPNVEFCSIYHLLWYSFNSIYNGNLSCIHLCIVLTVFC